MRRPEVTFLALALGLLLALPAAASAEAEASEPDHVKVQHILIGFRGSIRGKTIERNKSEAEVLAKELLEKARSGEDFATLVKDHTDDSYPGTYRMSNKGVEPGVGESRRYGMVTSFGNVSFKLDVGEVGMAEHHPTRSPFGWHIIKRIE